MSRYGWLLAALLLAVAVPAVLGGAELLPRLMTFPPHLLATLLGMIMLCWSINAWRLRLLLGQHGAHLSWSRSLGVIMATEFATCSTPGGSGGPLAMMAALSRERIDAARGGAVFAMDQLNDLLFFFCAMLGIAGYALSHKLGRSQESLLMSSAGLLTAALILAVGLLRYRRKVLRGSGRCLQTLGVKPERLRRWARKSLRFARALGETWRLPKRTLVTVFALTCAHWGLRFSVLYLVLQGLGANLGWVPSFLVQMLALSAGQVSLLPGGAGAAELTSATLLSPMVGGSTAAAAVLLWRLVTYHFYLLAGGPVFLCLVARPLWARWRRQAG